MTHAAEIRLETGATALGSKMELRVLAVSRSPVNAFDIELQYPMGYFEFLRASTADSVVSVWQSLPLKEKNGSVRLTGGMIEPLSGKGELITLVFRVKKSGTAEFVTKKGDFALADGKGTVVSAPEIRTSVAIAQNDAEEFSEAAMTVPKIAEVAVIKDPIERTAILSVRTEDDGAVKKVQVRSREWLFWSDWQESRLIASIPKGAWMAQVAVVGWEGGRDETMIYRWNVAALKLLAVLFVLAVLIYGGRRFLLATRDKRQETRERHGE
jgi:hypothetical protein